MVYVLHLKYEGSFLKVLQYNKTNESLDHFFPLTEYPQMRKWILMSMEKDGGFLPNPES